MSDAARHGAEILGQLTPAGGMADGLRETSRTVKAHRWKANTLFVLPFPDPFLLVFTFASSSCLLYCFFTGPAVYM